MSEKKFTPGPWSIKYDFNVFGDARLVAGCGGYSSNVNGEQVDAENKANALLIASAPEHFEALKKIAAFDGESIWMDSREDAADAMLEIARAALTKATQGSK